MNLPTSINQTPGSPTTATKPSQPARPRWQILLTWTLFRMRLAVASRRGLWALVVLAAVYGAFVLSMRLSGLLRVEVMVPVLIGLPAVAAVVGALLPRR